jgi:NADPH-dependent glutamate synthase beta subunit-like oxidoreductase
MLAHEIEAIRRRGVSFVTGWKLGGDNTIDGLMDDGFEAVCVAIGAHQPVGVGRIDIDEEGAGRTRNALDFLKDANAGRIESIAGDVLVVGGGDCAIDAARTSMRLGAESVTVLYRRGFEEMPARDEEIDEALAEGARFVCHGDPITVVCKGQDAAVVTVQKTRAGAADKSGRPRPEPIPGELFELHADEILLAIGEVPGNSDTFEAAVMTVGPDGTVTIDAETCATSRDAVFAAGDVAGTPRTVLDAIASGKRAAFGIDTYLSRGEREVAALDFLEPVAVDAGTSPSGGVGRVEGARRASIYSESVAYESACGSYTALERTAHERPTGLGRTLAPIGEAEAKAAAAACLICGACGECSVCLDMFGCPAMHVHEGKVRIDEELCTGCGVCALFCPNHAIVEVPLT